MKFAKRVNAVEYKNSPECTAFEYKLHDSEINGALIELTGRYPEAKRACNTVSKELVYVLKGSGKVVIEDSETSLLELDQLIIDPNERYYFEGNMTLFIASTPAWTPVQSKIVD